MAVPLPGHHHHNQPRPIPLVAADDLNPRYLDRFGAEHLARRRQWHFSPSKNARPAKIDSSATAQLSDHQDQYFQRGDYV